MSTDVLVKALQDYRKAARKKTSAPTTMYVENCSEAMYEGKPMVACQDCQVEPTVDWSNIKQSSEPGFADAKVTQCVPASYQKPIVLPERKPFVFTNSPSTQKIKSTTTKLVKEESLSQHLNHQYDRCEDITSQAECYMSKHAKGSLYEGTQKCYWNDDYQNLNRIAPDDRLKEDKCKPLVNKKDQVVRLLSKDDEQLLYNSAVNWTFKTVPGAQDKDIISMDPKTGLWRVFNVSPMYKKDSSVAAYDDRNPLMSMTGKFIPIALSRVSGLKNKTVIENDIEKTLNESKFLESSKQVLSGDIDPLIHDLQGGATDLSQLKSIHDSIRVLLNKPFLPYSSTFEFYTSGKLQQVRSMNSLTELYRQFN